MPNLYKMAKAFGRAIHGINSKENQIADAARKSYEKDLAAYRKNPSAAGRAEAFHRGSEEKWMDDRSIVSGKDGRPTTRLEDEPVADARNDVRMDENLQRDFDEAFDKAVKSNVRENPQRGFWSEDEIRAQAIDWLKSGKKIEDVLDFLYGNIDEVK